MNFADICCGINKLKIKQNVLEKNELDFIKSIRSNYGISLDEDFYTQIMTREEEVNELQKVILDHLRSLKAIKSMIAKENLEQIDLLKLKDSVISQESATELLKFRVNTDLDILLKQENDLNLDLTNLEMKIDDAVNNKLGMITSVRNAIEYKCQYQEIQDFATFVNTTGGHEGGWTYDDHLVFIRNYNKIKNTKKLVRILHNILPDISEDQILSHISWYKKYLDLRSKQKQVLEMWRKNKNKKPTTYDQSDSDNYKSDKVLSKYTSEEDEVTMRIKLKKWKEEKQEKLQQEQENKKKENFKNQLIQKNKELQNLEIKKHVNKWKSLKTVKEKADELEKDILSLKHKEKKIAVANKLIRDFQSQDNIYLIRRLNNLRLNKIAKVGKPARPQTLVTKGRRDPERVYKSTKQWVARINGDQQDLDDRVFFGTVTLKDIPKLGIPTWRASMQV